MACVLRAKDETPAGRVPEIKSVLPWLPVHGPWKSQLPGCSGRFCSGLRAWRASLQNSAPAGAIELREMGAMRLGTSCRRGQQTSAAGQQLVPRAIAGVAQGPPPVIAFGWQAA